MTWEYWTMIGVAAVAVGAGVVLYYKKKMGEDKLLALIATAAGYIRKAEKEMPEPKQGKKKKSYVLGFLQELFADVEDRLLNALIDMLVAILNACGWW